MKVLYDTGLRYNDVLLCFNTYISGDSFIVLPSKSNNARVISLSSIPVIFQEFVKGYDSLYFRISYQSLIRSLSQCSSYSTLQIGKKSVLLHLFRHNYMKKLFLAGKSLSEIALITGEKHISSVNSYVFSSIYAK